MPSLEEEDQREREVFDGVEDDDDVDDSDSISDTDEDDDEGEFHDVNVTSAASATLPSPPPSVSIPKPNSNPNPYPAAAPVSLSDPQSFSLNGVAVAPAPTYVPGSAIVPVEDEEARRKRVVEERRRAFEESRRLFQRLWTDEDELLILQGFYEFVSGRGTVHASHQHDTGPFYEQIKSRLQLDFTKNQLIEKLRRLKKKFRNVVARMSATTPSGFAYKSAHEKATFEIARKIWSSHLKRGRDFIEDQDILNLPIVAVPAEPNGLILDADAGDSLSNTRWKQRGRKRLVSTDAMASASMPSITYASIPASAGIPNHVDARPSVQELSQNVVEETVRCCLSPFFKELLNSVLNGSCRPAMDATFGANLMSMGLCGITGGVGADDDPRWRKQRIMELEVFSKRIELVQEQIKSTLEELRSAASS